MAAYQGALQAALLAKHFLCDFVVQSKRQIADKAQYGRSGGVVHAALHVLGSAIVLQIAGTPLTIWTILALADGVLHYHVDWIKALVLARSGWTIVDNRYWALFGADQLLHGLTYVVLAWAVCVGT